MPDKKNYFRNFKEKKRKHSHILFAVFVLLIFFIIYIKLFNLPQNILGIFSLPDMGRWTDLATNLLLALLAAIVLAITIFYKKSEVANKTDLSIKTETGNEFFPNFIDEIPVFFAAINADGTIRYMNKIMLDTLGYQRSEVLEKDFLTLFIPPGQQHMVRERYFGVYSKDSPTYNENILLAKDGKKLQTRWYVHPVFGNKDRLLYLNVIAIDITAQKNAESELEDLFIPKNEQDSLIAMKEEMVYSLLSEKDFSSKLNDSLQFLSKVLPNEGSFITILEDNQVRVAVTNGFKDVEGQKVIQNLNNKNHDFMIEKEAIHKQKTIIVNDTYEDFRWVVIPGLEWIKSCAKIPITFEGKTLGTLGIVSEKRNAFNQESIKKIESFTHGITNSIYNYLNYHQLHKSRDDIICTITRLVEARDPYTAGHQEKVAQLAVAIAEELELEEDRIESIKIASLVHDIGKINIPSEILNKPSSLNENEYSLVKNHSQSGYDILKDISFVAPIAKIVCQHHEKINGSGYPRGLKGENIMMEARIICVADVFEAMASDRPYRPSLGIEAAKEEILKNRGILYDPEVVDACLKVYDKIIASSIH